MVFFNTIKIINKINILCDNSCMFRYNVVIHFLLLASEPFFGVVTLLHRYIKDMCIPHAAVVYKECIVCIIHLYFVNTVG